MHILPDYLKAIARRLLRILLLRHCALSTDPRREFLLRLANATKVNAKSAIQVPYALHTLCIRFADIFRGAEKQRTVQRLTNELLYLFVPVAGD